MCYKGQNIKIFEICIYGEIIRITAMNHGKTAFAQLMSMMPEYEAFTIGEVFSGKVR